MSIDYLDLGDFGLSRVVAIEHLLIQVGFHKLKVFLIRICGKKLLSS
jgi:hypothetical protein